jgi:hypothetical protein
MARDRVIPVTVLFVFHAGSSKTRNQFYANWKKARTQAKEPGKLTAHQEEHQDRETYYESRAKNHHETKVVIPNDNDVLFGPGGAGKVFDHIGNQRYRAMGAESIQAYESCKKDENKRLLCTQVLVTALDNGSIFRKQDPGSKMWITVPYEAAFKKVQELFRTLKKKSVIDSGLDEYPDFSKPTELSQKVLTSRETDTGSVAERLEMIATLGNLPEAKYTYKVQLDDSPGLNWKAESVVSELTEIFLAFFIFVVIAQTVFLDGEILINIFYIMFTRGAPYLKSQSLLNPASMDGRYDGPMRMIDLALREHGYRLKHVQVYDHHDVNKPYDNLKGFFNYELPINSGPLRIWMINRMATSCWYGSVAFFFSWRIRMVDILNWSASTAQRQKERHAARVKLFAATAIRSTMLHIEISVSRRLSYRSSKPTNVMSSRKTVSKFFASSSTSSKTCLLLGHCALFLGTLPSCFLERWRK